MKELIQVAFQPTNLIYTVLLMVVLVYWLTVFLGFLDLDFLDIDIDTDLDLEMDVDIDADMDVDVDADTDTDIDGDGAGWFLKGLSFFNLGKIPFMVFLSFLSLSMWAIAMFSFAYFGQSLPWIGLIILLPNFMVSLVVTKFFTWPMIPVFKSLNKEASSFKDLVGKVATLKMDAYPNKRSQAEIMSNGSSFLLNVRSSDDQIIKKGTKVLLVEYRADPSEFLITHFEV
ncbi:MAG: YqiJ family protein [Bacteroidia bacterium]|nr:YqiJ family protein [Bacteroidia bacterium]